MKHSLHFQPAVMALLLVPGFLFSQTSYKEDLASSYKHYANVYEVPPVASNDYITGNDTRGISGNVLANDHDPMGKTLSAYLVANSPDGNISLTENGDFNFTPNEGFSGTKTTFSYKVCNGSLCSETAVVTISYPAALTLPATLVDFAANYTRHNDVVLNWKTTFENNNDHFDVELSTDGVNFTKIGSVKGSGTSNVSHTYTFNNNVDRQTTAKKDLYYRLRQVTTDERTATSKVLVARIYKTKSLRIVSVTPNPAVNDIKVNVELNEGSYVIIKLMNSAGTELMRKSVKSDAGLNSYTLDGTSKLEKGVYVLETIVNSNERMLVKLMKD